MDISKLSKDDLCGYESPITMAVRNHVDEVMEKRDNEIMARISQEMALDINKDELMKALQYDRDQYSKGYRDGYRAAEIKYEERLQEIRNLLGVVSPIEHQEQQFKVNIDGKTASELIEKHFKGNTVTTCVSCNHFGDGCSKCEVDDDG